jgi:hypothetical protein
MVLSHPMSLLTPMPMSIPTPAMPLFPERAPLPVAIPEQVLAVPASMRT